MNTRSRTLFAVIVISLVVGIPAVAQRRSGGGSGSRHTYHASAAAPVYGGGGGGYGYGPAFGGNGLSISPDSGIDGPPNYWWAGRYPSENPCQAGCNPNAGYEWDSVGTLILDSNPPNARVTLDGVYAGTTDKLGPFQLPVGQHTLHIEAAGFEPTDVIVKFDQPGVQSLNVELKHLTALAKPGPRP